MMRSSSPRASIISVGACHRLTIDSGAASNVSVRPQFSIDTGYAEAGEAVLEDPAEFEALFAGAVVSGAGPPEEPHPDKAMTAMNAKIGKLNLNLIMK
ncbi:hypothetical protein [Paenibacillus lemnae]|uniref:hypothetical protein n=1 Tax=Paenibacillus lemnae TaxID=1330551 RepID=UPI001FE5D123|nr:hypothetical protein [Paenibacillus lemnae]